MLGDIILYLNLSNFPKLTELEKKSIIEKIDEVKKLVQNS